MQKCEADRVHEMHIIPGESRTARASQKSVNSSPLFFFIFDIGSNGSADRHIQICQSGHDVHHSGVVTGAQSRRALRPDDDRAPVP